MKSDTICWKCGNTMCSWARGIPVDGWTAKQYEYKIYTIKDKSYVVYGYIHTGQKYRLVKSNFCMSRLTYVEHI